MLSARLRKCLGNIRNTSCSVILELATRPRESLHGLYGCPCGQTSPDSKLTRDANWGCDTGMRPVLLASLQAGSQRVNAHAYLRGSATQATLCTISRLTPCNPATTLTAGQHGPRQSSPQTVERGENSEHPCQSIPRVWSSVLHAEADAVQNLNLVHAHHTTIQAEGRAWGDPQNVQL